MKRSVWRPWAIALSCLSLIAGCSTTNPPATGIMLRSVQGYHVGGSRVSLSGLPVKEVQVSPGGPSRKSDPNGDYEVGQLYVQKFLLTAPQAPYPLMLWHGGGLTGATWENTPDGRSGWHEYFMHQGHDTLVSDSVERGRASWARYPEINHGEPEHRTINQAWNLFRFGPDGGYAADPTQRKVFANTQFPIDAVEQFQKQFVARWTTSDALAQKAYNALVQKECPCVILAHSQGAVFAFQAALSAPERVKAVIVIEPTGAPDPSKSDLAVLRAIPHLAVWGDHFQDAALWRSYRSNATKYLDAIKAVGSKVDVIDLPAKGIHGNTHMMMMDHNSDQIAEMVQDWIKTNGLMKP
jgi:pimeloyl-ACP methyl ester carboxylesterase